jgi:16S rRNA processing protein RimM
VALLARAWGIRGELIAIPLSDRLERFQNLGRVYLFGSGPAAQFEVESARNVPGSVIFKFRGIDSMTDAERCRGAEVRIPREERLEPEPGEFFIGDLIGCEVVERGTGQSLGSVTGWDEGGASGLLQVGPDLLIPFARSICVSIDIAGKRIEVDLPEGLKDLNRS